MDTPFVIGVSNGPHRPLTARSANYPLQAKCAQPRGLLAKKQLTNETSRAPARAKENDSRSDVREQIGPQGGGVGTCISWARVEVAGIARIGARVVGTGIAQAGVGQVCVG